MTVITPTRTGPVGLLTTLAGRGSFLLLVLESVAAIRVRPIANVAPNSAAAFPYNAIVFAGAVTRRVQVQDGAG